MIFFFFNQVKLVTKIWLNVNKFYKKREIFPIYFIFTSLTIIELSFPKDFNATIVIEFFQFVYIHVHQTLQNLYVDFVIHYNLDNLEIPFSQSIQYIYLYQDFLTEQLEWMILLFSS